MWFKIVTFQLLLRNEQRGIQTPDLWDERSWQFDEIDLETQIVKQFERAMTF